MSPCSIRGSVTDGLQERPFGVPLVSLCVVWMFPDLILIPAGMSF